MKEKIRQLKFWWIKRCKKKLPYSERGYVLNPQMKERTDGRMVTYERKIRCEVPEPDGSGDFCVNALPVGEVCTSHWCLRSNSLGGIYQHSWKDNITWDYYKRKGEI